MSNPPSVIALSGNRGVGKNTLFDRIKELRPHARDYAFAAQLKEDLVPLIGNQFSIDPRTATGADKELIRPMLIAYGCAWRERDPEHWVKVVVQEILIRAAMTDGLFLPVVTDVRFPNEAIILREAFGPALYHVDVDSTNAPAPTAEEEKHYRLVRRMADYQMTWGNNTYEEQLSHARHVLQAADNR